MAAGFHLRDDGSAATAPNSRTVPARADPCADPRPACPVCGGLKCLCRPRFFPGQLLSDDDLNRLQRYVIDKNKLHNRYLVGWGVACGLEVSCSPCEADSVLVRAGYALSPCGDDIVVCGDQSVPICRLIDACRPPQPVCDPPYGSAPAECKTGIERWVLAVCYDERPSRGITALTGAGDTSCGSSCSCGGSGGCGCQGSGKAASGTGCGTADCACKGASSSSAYAKTARRGLLPQCEPTQVCEGFRFTAYKAPARSGFSPLPPSTDSTVGGLNNNLLLAWLYANRARFGPLLERALCCVLTAMDLRGSLLQGQARDTGRAVGVYRDYAQALQEFAAEFALHHCSFVSTVRGQYDSAVEWSRTRLHLNELPQADRAELAGRFDQLNLTWMQIVTECFCSALLPACPAPAMSNCVPLAVVTLQTGEHCKVLDICNWEERKLLITWPTVLYWLSWLPWHRLRESIARICCGTGRESSAYALMTAMLGVAMSGMQRAKAQMSTQPFGGAAAPVGGVPDSGTFDFNAAMQSDDLMAHMLGDYERARSGAAGAPAWTALLARVVDGTAFAPLAGNAAVDQVDMADLSRRLGVEAMQAQVTKLQETVQRQHELLQALKIVHRDSPDR